MLRKVALGGAALWVAPAVLALDTKPASASPNCPGATPRTAMPFPGSGADLWTLSASANSASPFASAPLGAWSNGDHMGYNANPWPDVGFLSGPNFIVVRNPVANQTPFAHYCRTVRLCADTRYTFTFPLAAERVASGTIRPQTFRARITPPSASPIDLPLTSTAWTGSYTFLQTRGTAASGGFVPPTGWTGNRWLNAAVTATYPSTGTVAVSGDYTFCFRFTFPVLLPLHLPDRRPDSRRRLGRGRAHTGGRVRARGAGAGAAAGSRRACRKHRSHRRILPSRRVRRIEWRIEY